MDFGYISRPCGLDFVVGFADGIGGAEELAVKIDFIMTAAVVDGEHRHHSFRCIYVPLNLGRKFGPAAQYR